MAKNIVKIGKEEISKMVNETVKKVVGRCICESENGEETFAFENDENGKAAFDMLMKQNIKTIYGDENGRMLAVTVLPGEVSYIDVWKFLMRHNVNFILPKEREADAL